MDKRMQSHEAYKALPAKVAQKVLDQLDQAWQSFFEARAAYNEDPSKFTGRPRLPKYKHKTEGRNLLIYTMQAVSRGKRSLQRGIIKPSMLPIEVKTQQNPKQMEQVTNTRTRQVTRYLHAASKRMIDFLVKEGVGTIIVGKNPLWKQEAGMAKRNNQNFVSIPHARFIEMLTYKASLVGIQVEVQEESYTSQASFLDLDPIPTYKPDDDTEYTFSGKRIGRRNRLYRSKDGQIICAH